MSGEVLSDIEVLCWQLAAQLTGAMLSAGVPAVLTLLALFDSLQADSIAAGVRRLERRAVTTVALLALAWVPWYGVADKPLNMPPAWYLLALLGAETDSAVRAALPDKTALNEKMVALASADLAGHPELRREYSQFERDCYVPARQKAASLGVLAKETSWPGARALVDTAGLYRSCGAETGGACSRGFFAATGAPAAASGRAAVSCRDWWLGDSDSAAAAGTSTAAGAAGLRQRMVGALRDDTEAIWNEPLQEGDGEAWLKSYLLRSPSAVADFVGDLAPPGPLRQGLKLTSLWKKAREWVEQSWGAAEQTVGWLGSATLAWKIGARGVLLLYLAPEMLAQLQIFLLALIALLWPAIALLSGMSAGAFWHCCRFWLTVRLWTLFTALGEMLQQLLWQLNPQQVDSLATLALRFSDAKQLMLWYLSASLPWVTPLLGSWLLLRLSRSGGGAASASG